MDINQIVSNTIGVEGRYSNNPADTGGATCWGITETVARKHDYTGDMRLLPRETAIEIYKAEFWAAPGFDRVALLSEKIAQTLFDIGVNMGVETAAMFLQRALNAMNDGQHLFFNMVIDGKLGATTLGNLHTYLTHRATQNGELVLWRAINCLRGARYIELTEGRPADKDFIFGWILNRVGV